MSNNAQFFDSQLFAAYEAQPGIMVDAISIGTMLSDPDTMSLGFEEAYALDAPNVISRVSGATNASGNLTLNLYAPLITDAVGHFVQGRLMLIDIGFELQPLNIPQSTLQGTLEFLDINGTAFTNMTQTFNANAMIVNGNTTPYWRFYPAVKNANVAPTLAANNFTQKDGAVYRPMTFLRATDDFQLAYPSAAGTPSVAKFVYPDAVSIVRLTLSNAAPNMNVTMTPLTAGRQAGMETVMVNLQAGVNDLRVGGPIAAAYTK